MNRALKTLVDAIEDAIKDHDPAAVFVASYGLDDNPDMAKIIYDMSDESTIYIIVEREDSE